MRLNTIFSFHYFLNTCSHLCAYIYVCVCIDLFIFVPYVDLCNHYHNQDAELFHHHKITLLCTSLYSHPPHCSSLLCPSALETTSLFFIILSFWKCYINGTTQYVTFWDKLLFTRYNAFEPHSDHWCTLVYSFLLLSSISLFGYTRVHSAIHLLKDIWLFSLFCYC